MHLCPYSQVQKNDANSPNSFCVWHEGIAARGKCELASCFWRILEGLNKKTNVPLDVVFWCDNCSAQVSYMKALYII